MSYKTLKQISDEVANTFQDTGAARVSRIKEAIGRHYADYCKAFPWPQLISIEQDAISLTSGQKTFFTPYRMGEILGIFPSDQSVMLDPIEIAGYLRRHGQLDDLATTGWMSSYTKVGTFGHAVEIASAEKIIITPSSTDISNQVTIAVTIHGISNGDEFVEEITCTNGVPQTSARSYTEIYSIASDGAQTDVLYASGQLSISIYVRLPAGVRTVRYNKYRVGAAPAEAKTLTVAFKKEPMALFRDNQVPEIPVSDALYHKALADLYRSMRKPGPIAQSEDSLADQMASRAFEESTIQGQSGYQAAPLERYRLLPGMRRW